MHTQLTISTEMIEDSGASFFTLNLVLVAIHCSWRKQFHFVFSALILDLPLVLYVFVIGSDLNKNCLLCDFDTL